ncbi:MAG: NAD-dependent epimerase/dehydratase family protein [Gemmatimonadota bacterium]
MQTNDDDARRADVERSATVLVTGAAGFIGSHLCEALLDAGCSVWGLDSFHPYYSPAVKRRNLRAASGHPKMHVVQGDIRDGVLLDGLLGGRAFDAAVHLAALPGVRTSLEAPDVCMDINVQGTLTLLEALARHEIDRLVFASSSSVYGEDTAPPFRESDAADRPISPYAASKRAGEMLCHSYSATHGLSVHCLRIFTAFGPRQRPDLAIHKFARLMRGGEPIPLFGDGASERDYTYVGDVVAGVHRSLLRLLDLPDDATEYEIVNLGRGSTVRLDDLVRALSSAVGVEPEIDRLPDQPGDMPMTHADVERAGELLGWSAETSLEEGLAAFVGWLDTVEPVDDVRDERPSTAGPLPAEVQGDTAFAPGRRSDAADPSVVEGAG